MSERRPVERVAPWVGLAVGLLVPVMGFALSRALGSDLAPRALRTAVPSRVPPLQGYWQPTWFGPGTVPALALAVLGWRYGKDLAARLPWHRLLAASFAVSLAWLASLALVRGTPGISGILTSRYSFLPTARSVGSIHQLLETFTERIPLTAAPDNWTTSVAGHPPGMLLFFVLLDRVGLGADITVGLVVILVAASIAVATPVTLRALGQEAAARRAAPFLVFTPSAIFLAVSADAVITAVVAWGLACLAISATSSGRRLLAWGALAGLLLGGSVLMSYGMLLMGVVAVAVLVAARCWRPLTVAVPAALAVVVVFAALGFSWWEAFPVLRERYYAGIAQYRPQSYWLWGDLGALLISAGPLVGAGLAAAGVAAVGRVRGSHREVLLLVGATAVVVAAADVSGMSKAEVERIWLPFVPWLTVSLALLPERWRSWGLGLQLLTALLLEHLLNTVW